MIPSDSELIAVLRSGNFAEITRWRREWGGTALSIAAGRFADRALEAEKRHRAWLEDQRSRNR